MSRTTASELLRLLASLDNGDDFTEPLLPVVQFRIQFIAALVERSPHLEYVFEPPPRLDDVLARSHQCKIHGQTSLVERLLHVLLFEYSRWRHDRLELLDNVSFFRSLVVVHDPAPLFCGPVVLYEILLDTFDLLPLILRPVNRITVGLLLFWRLLGRA